MLAAVLCALLAVTPVEGKRYDAQAASSSDSSSSTTHTSKKSGSSSTKKPAPSTSHTTTSSKKPASATEKKTSTTTHHSATAPRGKKKYVSPAERRRRAARAHKIKLAFVASTELRPMAQQLATLRTPAAYAGVTSYAHAHSGEAAAAAYLALGHAYFLDKRYT
ncbi:MAG: lytic transglycosylase, partial [Terracidiphilus sp.]